MWAEFEEAIQTGGDVGQGIGQIGAGERGTAGATRLPGRGGFVFYIFCVGVYAYYSAFVMVIVVIPAQKLNIEVRSEYKDMNKQKFVNKNKFIKLFFILTDYGIKTIISYMKKKVQRRQITARISEDASMRLVQMVQTFLGKSKNTTQASQGKIIETLLLWEGAEEYVEQKIFDK